MNDGISTEASGSSTRPYLIRALFDWCVENGFTPYLAVHVDESVRVPGEYVKNNEIVLNVSFDATSGLKLGNEWIEFKARFGGVAREIAVPVDHVIAIYARENGQGMAFPVPTPAAVAGPATAGEAGAATKGGPAIETGPLRLANPASPTEGAAGAPTKGPPAAPSGATEPGAPVPPRPGAPAGGKRPALKRVK